MERDVAEIKKDVKKLRQWLVTLPLALFLLLVAVWVVSNLILRTAK